MWKLPSKSTLFFGGAPWVEGSILCSRAFQRKNWNGNSKKAWGTFTILNVSGLWFKDTRATLPILNINMTVHIFPFMYIFHYCCCFTRPHKYLKLNCITVQLNVLEHFSFVTLLYSWLYRAVGFRWHTIK